MLNPEIYHDYIPSNIGPVAVFTDELPEGGFETMVFPLNKNDKPIYAKPYEQFTRRYLTGHEASMGHVEVVVELNGIEFKYSTNDTGKGWRDVQKP